ncbi:MAG: YkvA family protein [Demequina sp.]
MWWKFLRAVRRGEHKLAPLTWVTAVAAVIYTMIPIDLIPELFFGPVGLIDDLGFWGIVAMLATREKNAWAQGRARRARVVDV